MRTSERGKEERERERESDGLIRSVLLSSDWPVCAVASMTFCPLTVPIR